MVLRAWEVLLYVVAVVLVELQVPQWVVVGVVGAGPCVGWQAWVFLGCVVGLVRPAIGGVAEESGFSGVVECAAWSPSSCVVALCVGVLVEGRLEAVVQVGASLWLPEGWS